MLQDKRIYEKPIERQTNKQITKRARERERESKGLCMFNLNLPTLVPKNYS